jgi:hypothetical protein
MTPDEFNDLTMRIIDWYEDLNKQNMRDTSDVDIAEKLPPFMRFSQNNGFTYIDPSTGQMSSLTEIQQSELTNIIATERNNLTTTRNELRARVSGGKRKKRTKRRKSKKSKKSKKLRKSRKNNRFKKL